MGKILSGPWIEQRKEQKPVPCSSGTSSQDLGLFITETRQALQQVSIPFKTSGDICPIHCRKALNALDCLNEGLATVCHNLHQSASPAVMLAPSRYPVLIDLYHIQEDASRLMGQLDDFRISCLRSTRRLYPRRREIMTLFDKVMRHLEVIPDRVTSLDKDIEVQEQRLHTIIEQEVLVVPPSEPYPFNKSIARKK